MSKNTPFTSRWLLKDWYILWLVERSWFMQKSLGWKPDWFDDNKSFSLENLYNSIDKRVFQRSYCRFAAVRLIVGSF